MVTNRVVRAQCVVLGGILIAGLTACLSEPEPPAAIDSIEVLPASIALEAIGETAGLYASARDAAGNSVASASYHWSTSAPHIVNVKCEPVTHGFGGSELPIPLTLFATVTAIRPGTATITATAGGVSGQIVVTVVPTDAVVEVSPASVTLTALGHTQQFRATVTDMHGTVIPSVVFRWTSTDPTVAIVDDSGLAVATGHGSSLIVATALGVSDSAAVTVEP